MADSSAIGNSKEQLLDPYRTRGSRPTTSALNHCFYGAEVFRRMLRLLAFASNRSPKKARQKEGLAAVLTQILPMRSEAKHCEETSRVLSFRPGSKRYDTREL